MTLPVSPLRDDDDGDDDDDSIDDDFRLTSFRSWRNGHLKKVGMVDPQVR